MPVKPTIPPEAPLHPWEWPEHPWHRLHMDYAGPLLGHMFLIVIDAHSKWIDVMPVSAANATQTIEKLRLLFATHGIPDTLVSDNGSPFVNEEMAYFTAQNGIRHIWVAPTIPRRMGLRRGKCRR